MSDALRYIVGPAADFADGERRIVTAGRRSIGVFRVGDRFYAVRNRCPHQGAPLCRGAVLPRLTSTGPGNVALDDRPPLISCPWHAWEYDLETGQSFVPADPGVKRYAVSVEPGTSLQGAQVAEPQGRAGARGPYVVEAYTVTVDERDQVVINL